MKIALVSSYIPFLYGGYRNIVDWLESTLTEQGHHVEKIYLPQIDNPDTLFQQMMIYRWIDLSMADRVICFRPQSHLIQHPHKILWFIHHIRIFYDLWDTPRYRTFPSDDKYCGIKNELVEIDNAALAEAKHIFTNSKIVSDRLKKYNNVESEVLYPPVFKPERFYCNGYSDEIVCVCRFEHHKRQHLLIEAMQYAKSPVKLRLMGAGMAYANDLSKKIKSLNLNNRVTLDNRWISEEEKIEQFANCLASAYIPLEEDSYGYPSIESSLSHKPILTTNDSGGVLELIEDGVNGYITNPDPKDLAVAMDKFYIDRERTIEMGQKAFEKLKTMNISWDYILERILA